MNNKNLIFVILILISTLGQVASDLYLPSLPAISMQLGTDFSAVKLTITAFMIGFAASPLFYGPLSDGIGRHKPLLLGLSLCLLGSLLCVMAPTIEVLMLGRLLQGIGAGSGSSLFRPILRDLYSGTELAKYGAYSALVSVAALAFAPLLGGYLQYFFGWRANFIFLSVFTLTALLSVIFLIPETNVHLHPENLSLKKIKTNLRTLITSSIFMGYSTLNFLAYGAVLAWLTAGPILLQNTLGLSAVRFGWTYALTGVAFALGAFINIKFVARVGTQRLLQWGMLSILTAGLLLLGFKGLGYLNVFVIVIPVCLLLFGAALVFSNAFANAFQPFPTIAGIAGALFGTLTTLGGVVTSGVLALAHDTTQTPMGLVVMSCGFLQMIIYRFVCGWKAIKQI